MTSDRGIRKLTAAAVLLVAAIAAVVSFVHIEHLAVTHGQAELAALLLPLSIDGTIAAASLVMLRAARAGLGTPWLARFMLGLAVAATLAANIGYGLPYGIAGALISGWPACAFVGTVELAIGMVRRGSAAAPEPVRVPVPRPARTRTAPARRTRSAPVNAFDAESEFAAVLASGALPSIREIRARMHVGQDRARALHTHLAGVAGRT